MGKLENAKSSLPLEIIHKLWKRVFNKVKKNREKTPNSIIKSALRRLWLRSRERSSALRRDKYSCRCCGVKQSRAKDREVYVEVHHRKGILQWKRIFKFIRKELLCDPEDLITWCDACHKNTDEEKGKFSPNPRTHNE